MEQVQQAVEAARKAKIKNVSLDLIYGLPHQTAERWMENLAAAVALAPEHLSCYGLKVEEGTPLYAVRDSAGLPGDEEQVEMYLQTVEFLKQYGLTERHARALLRLEDEEERLDALRHMIRGHLNVAQTEQYIEKRLARLQATPPAGRRIFLLKDVRLFLNSLERGLRLIREAGVGAESRREDTEDAILLTIRIPKAAGHPPAP